MDRSELLRLLAACKDTPDDDAPRLVLADWLEEYGDESDQARAAFIRAQLAGDRRAVPRPEWHDPLSCIGGRRGTRYERGLARVTVSPMALYDDINPTLAASEAWAWVEELILDGGDHVDAEEVFRSPFLDRIGSLVCRRIRSPEVKRPLAGCQRLESLRSLSISMQGWRDEDAPLLAAAAYLPQLRGLDLSGNYLQMGGLASLLGSGRLAGLLDLDLGRNPLGPDGMQVLAASAGLPRLQKLRLSHCDAGFAGAESLAAWQGMTALQSLRLDWNAISDDGVVALSRAALSLRELSLAANGISGAGAAVLASTPWLDTVESLELSENLHIGSEFCRSPRLSSLRRFSLADAALGDDGIQRLVSNHALHSLSDLDLKGNRLDETAMRRLAKASFPLRRLCLRGNSIRATGLRSLTDLVGYSSLHHLLLSDTQAGDGGAAIVAASLPVGLYELDLSYNDIGPKGAVALAASPALAEVRCLDLSGNPLGNEGLRALLESPHLQGLDRLALWRTGHEEGMDRAVRERFGSDNVSTEWNYVEE